MMRRPAKALISNVANLPAVRLATCGTKMVEATVTKLVMPRVEGKPPTAKPRSPGQRPYLEALGTKSIVACVAPAGTGKTYLAVAKAVEALDCGKVDRIVLSRPAVEAGERLGFLPGDLREKMDPYMRPLFDALHDRMTPSHLASRLSDGTIEIAPLAFLRGRTLSRCFVILDEASNATRGQLSMFLGRIGEGSSMAVVGDPTQSDLEGSKAGGLAELATMLEGVDPDVAVIRMDANDIVRHRLVKKLLPAISKWTEARES